MDFINFNNILYCKTYTRFKGLINILNIVFSCAVVFTMEMAFVLQIPLLSLTSRRLNN